MYTQCPVCKTVYRLHIDQLKAARGQVRCSRCHATFDALDNLFEQQEETQLPQPPQARPEDGAGHPSRTPPVEKKPTTRPTPRRGSEPGQPPSSRPESRPAPRTFPNVEPSSTNRTSSRPAPRMEQAPSRTEPKPADKPSSGSRSTLTAKATSREKTGTEQNASSRLTSKPATRPLTGGAPSSTAGSTSRPGSQSPRQVPSRPASRPEREAAEKIELKSIPTPQPLPGFEAKPTPKPHPEAKRERKPSPKAEPTPVSQTLPGFEPAPAPRPRPKPTTEQKPGPKAKPQPASVKTETDDIDSLLSGDLLELFADTPKIGGKDKANAERPENRAAPTVEGRPEQPASPGKEKPEQAAQKPATEESARALPLSPNSAEIATAETSELSDGATAEPAEGPSGYTLAPEFEQKAAQSGFFATLLWGLGIVIMLAGLGGQYLYYNRQVMAANPEIRPFLERVCTITGCRLPPRRELSAIELGDHLVQSHPRYENSLLITATLLNRADFIQPYPVLEVVMTNLRQEEIARRRFLPKEYLVGDHDPMSFKPDNEVPLMLEVLDPGKQAVGFEFNFF